MNSEDKSDCVNLAVLLRKEAVNERLNSMLTEKSQWWRFVLDQLGPSWSKVLVQERKTQQNDDQLGQVSPTWQYWDQLSGKGKEPKPKLFGPDIFGWGGSLPREGVGAKSLGYPLKTQGNKLFGGISQILAGISRGHPKSLR